MSQHLRVELLTRVLGMTSSSNDNEALTAARKANAILREAGWTWETLLQGKITIVADPFSGLTPPAPRAAEPPRPQPPQRPYTPPPYTPPPPPPPPSYAASGSNNYDGFCYFCGTSVAAQRGHRFRKPGAVSTFVACSPCNNSYTSAAWSNLRSRAAKPKRDLNSFLNDIS